jgi:5S rRNA maturation endonuclease (ribonuclease M5)
MPVQPSLFDPVSAAPAASTTEARLAAARLQGLVHELTLLNNEIPVIVEGRRDVTALRRLGLQGTILTLHCGLTVAAFAEQIARRFPSVILLLDWDRRGRQLHAQLTRHLEAEWEEYTYIRQELIALSKSAISSIEDVPALLATHEASSTTLPCESSAAGRQPIP